MLTLVEVVRELERSGIGNKNLVGLHLIGAHMYEIPNTMLADTIKAVGKNGQHLRHYYFISQGDGYKPIKAKEALNLLKGHECGEHCYKEPPKHGIYGD